MIRLAVLASGGGSNLQAIFDHFAALGENAPGRVVVVISDRQAAGALEKARAQGVEALHIPKSAPEGALEKALVERQIDVVVLAGYLRLVPAAVVRRWTGRIVNIHPALLPAFGGPGMYGHHVHDAVVAAGVLETGCTVHHVTEEYDQGAVIEQARVPVHSGDTAEVVAKRVLREEHKLYPRVIEQLCRALRLGNERKL